MEIFNKIYKHRNILNLIKSPPVHSSKCIKCNVILYEGLAHPNISICTHCTIVETKQKFKQKNNKFQ